MNIRRHIPNAITCCNILSGVLAIICSIYMDSRWWGLTGLQWTWICIGCAALFDFADGACARLLHAYSELGKQLDSLCDLVSFGVAPAIIMFMLINSINGAFTPWSLAVVAIPVCGALRLAKFNIDTRQTTSFIGLPIPANAIFWIGASSLLAGHAVVPPCGIAAVILFVSLLMVMEIKLFSLKFKNFTIADNIRRYALLLGAAMFIIMQGVTGLLTTIILYIILSSLPHQKAE